MMPKISLNTSFLYLTELIDLYYGMFNPLRKKPPASFSVSGYSKYEGDLCIYIDTKDSRRSLGDDKLEEILGCIRYAFDTDKVELIDSYDRKIPSYYTIAWSIPLPGNDETGWTRMVRDNKTSKIWWMPKQQRCRRCGRMLDEIDLQHGLPGESGGWHCEGCAIIVMSQWMHKMKEMDKIKGKKA